MKYYSKVEIEEAVKNNETISISDEVIDKMRAGKSDSYILREGLCGRNIKTWDFSGLSEEYLAYLSFDTETQFPEYLQEKANSLLESSKCIIQEIEKLHDIGLDGTGRKITIIDTPFELTKDDEDIEYYQMAGAETENHGVTVLSIIKSIVPNAQIVFIGENKRAGENRQQILNDFIRDNLDSTAIYDSDIVSISSPLSIDSKFVDSKCEILNSPRFYSSNQKNLGFRYGFVRRTSKVENIEPADCISEGKDRNEAEMFCLEKLEQLGLRYTEINPSNIDEIVNKLKDVGISEDDSRISFLKKVAMSDEEYRINSINEDKLITPGRECNQELVCIPSAGITVRQNGGKFKYMATNSNSFSIPVVSALFTIARQLNPNISLDEFSEICRSTSIERDGFKIITPIGIVEAIKEKQNVCTFEQIGRGTTQSFTQNTGEAISAFETFEQGVKNQEQMKEGQVQGED